jgi:hypothetical protein
VGDYLQAGRRAQSPGLKTGDTVKAEGRVWTLVGISAGDALLAPRTEALPDRCDWNLSVVLRNAELVAPCHPGVTFLACWAHYARELALTPGRDRTVFVPERDSPARLIDLYPPDWLKAKRKKRT